MVSSWHAGVARDGKDERNGSNQAGWVYNGRRQEAKILGVIVGGQEAETEILVENDMEPGTKQLKEFDALRQDYLKRA